MKNDVIELHGVHIDRSDNVIFNENTNKIEVNQKGYLNVVIECDEVDFDIPEGYEYDDFKLELTIKWKPKKEISNES